MITLPNYTTATDFGGDILISGPSMAAEKFRQIVAANPGVSFLGWKRTGR